MTRSLSEQSVTQLAVPSYSKLAVRTLMRCGFDTMQIAKLLKTTEAAVWNALGDPWL